MMSDYEKIGLDEYNIESYEEVKENFKTKAVNNYDLCDAMIDGVLPKPIYKSAYIQLVKTLVELEKKLEKENHNTKKYKELSKILNDIRNQIHLASSMKDVFKENIKKDGKYYYFCPINSEENVNDIATIMEKVKEWCQEIGLTDDDYEFYLTTSKMGEERKKNRQAFYNDEDLNGNKVNYKLRIMFAINQYNEGVHAPGVDGVIMGRSTKSDIAYYKQLGRGLSVRENYKEEYDKLYQKDISELRELCKARNREITDDMEKEEIIEMLLAPIIIDLANNIDYIKKLENNLKARVREVRKQHNNKTNRRVIHLSTTNFNISMINQNLYEILKYVMDRLFMTWMDKYNLAKIYYEHYSNLEIPYSFKTINGYEYDENGINLGIWVFNQRRAYKGQVTNRITEEQIKLLKQIKMRFENIDKMERWLEKYNLAKAYYEHYSNLEIPQSFKTINGYEYDENGYDLGNWVYRQRDAYNGIGNYKLTEEQIKLLKEIKMNFKIVTRNDNWMYKYNLAKAYYEHYGNLEIPYSFKTINGYEYDDNGVDLGIWVYHQYDAYNGKGKSKLTEERIKLLEEIGMCFEKPDKNYGWMDKYNLAKIYYEHHGNLEIPRSFKTISGYEYNKHGIKLGEWILRQRRAYNGKGKYKLTEEQIKLLEKIGMRFENVDRNEAWMDKYNLAKAYYEHHGNLEIPRPFKTVNGYDYDENGYDLGNWVYRQIQAYKGQIPSKITAMQIYLLEQIKIRWFNENINDKFQKELITEDNRERKQTEIINRFISYLNQIDDDKLDKNTMNDNFKDSLDNIYHRK